ncbi:hypothetical protein JVT61DRAFT_9178 [Boletus reticuloceps]|uniref:DUF6534 domain-containing protein n=1 Tax=Boletus reticuloceps TaxID=495285 RepID=A0A8I2YHF4_9AGAM|nr:hypothetical protein JVT61DRAFT_9178 [Boletus reticuloceps]
MGLYYESTIGTLLVGIFFNTFLYGLVTYQFAAYCRIKFNDRPVTKYMVLFLFILDTVHSTSVIYMAWNYLVANYDNPAALAVAEWPHTFTPIATALAALVTQLYLGFRIWCLTSSWVLYGVVILLAIPSFVLGVACSIEAWIIKVLSELPRLTPLVIAWLSMQVIVDAFITITLIIVFSRSRTGFCKTDTIINRLIRGAIQTGLFTGIFSMGDLITFVVLPSTDLYGMFAIPIGRIYTNTLLDTLLTRESLKAEMVNTYDVNAGTGPLRWAPTDSSQATSTVQSSSIHLKVQQTVQETCDRSSTEVDGKVVPLAV